jgi:hypothetical protein
MASGKALMTRLRGLAMCKKKRAEKRQQGNEKRLAHTHTLSSLSCHSPRI